MWYRKSSPHKGLFFNVNGKALWEFDPVAFFKLSKAKRGRKDLFATYGNVDWHFAEESHKALFEENPVRYLPQFGGYCAHGMAHGYAASTNPLRWSIINNKLYLNYSRLYQKRWLRKKEVFIELAEKNWIDVQKSL